MFLENCFKPFLSNKVQSYERIKLAEEDDTLITNEEEVAMKLNDFVINAVTNLRIPEFKNFDFKNYFKCIKKHNPSIIAIASDFTKECFSLIRSL